MIPQANWGHREAYTSERLLEMYEHYVKEYFKCRIFNHYYSAKNIAETLEDIRRVLLSRGINPTNGDTHGHDCPATPEGTGSSETR